MKNFKRLFTATLILITLVASAYAATVLPRDGAPGFPAIQVMTPPATSPVVTISAAGNVDVSSYKVIMFGSDLDIYWGSDSGNTYPYIANTPLGIAVGVTTIHVSAACKMLVM